MRKNGVQFFTIFNQLSNIILIIGLFAIPILINTYLTFLPISDMQTCNITLIILCNFQTTTYSPVSILSLTEIDACQRQLSQVRQHYEMECFILFISTFHFYLFYNLKIRMSAILLYSAEYNRDLSKISGRNKNLKIILTLIQEGEKGFMNFYQSGCYFLFCDFIMWQLIKKTHYYLLKKHIIIFL